MAWLGADGRRRLAATVFALIAGGVLLSAFFPFDWDPPRDVPNQVVRNAAGELVFTGPSQARTPGPASWLPDAVSWGSFEVSLVVTPASASQDGPARILAVSRSVLSADLMVGQQAGDLVVRIREPTRDLSGNPARIVPDVFAAGRDVEIDAAVEADLLTISVDGEEQLVEQLPPGFLETWDQTMPLALGNEPRGSRPWEGTISGADVSTPNGPVDYLEPGNLEIPDSYRYITHRPWDPFPPEQMKEWLALGFHLAVFVALGAAACTVTEGRHPVAWWIGLGIASAAIQLAKVGFAGRHPSVAQIVAETLGAGIGVAAAVALARRRAPDHVRKVRVHRR